MTASEAATAKPARATWGETFAVYLQPRVLIVLFLGLSCGLPLALCISTVPLWMRESGVDLATIGLFTLVGTPYTIKFLWAPLIDASDAPLLSRMLGRRRGWLVFSQLLLIAAILVLALTDPAQSPFYVALAAVLVTTASATQDTVVDAFRVESLPENEQAAGMAVYVAAYRIGLLISTAGVLFLVSGFESSGLSKSSAWMWGFVAMAGMIGIGIVASLLATEPDRAAVKTSDWDNYHLEFNRVRAAFAWLSLHVGWIARPFDAIRRGRGRLATELREVGSRIAATRTFKAAYVALGEFLIQRDAVVVLIFVVLFKFTDAFSGTMTAPLVIDLGYTRTDYAAIVKGVGFGATLLGGFAGGYLARAWSLPTCLWFAGIIQALSNLVFVWLASISVNQWALAAAITAENFSGAIGTVIFVAYLSALCNNPLHTATQYALLAALSSVGRTYMSAFAGYVAESTGWPLFYAISVAVAAPSLALLAWLHRRGHFSTITIKV